MAQYNIKSTDSAEKQFVQKYTETIMKKRDKIIVQCIHTVSKLSETTAVSRQGHNI